MSKRCTCCLQWKERSQFYRDRTKLDGLKSQCKDCRKLYRRGYRARLRAREKARLRRTYMRVWLARPRKPLRLDLTPGFARWCQKNRQRRRAFLSEYLKQWHISNPAASRVWNQSQPASQTTRRQAHRSALSNAPINDLGSDEWEWLVDIYEHRCAYCGRVDDHLTPDHILPLAMGGSNTLSNIAPACRACNTKKGARTPEQSQMNFAVVVDITHHLQQLGLM